MTVPMGYLYASRDFRRFLGAVKERAMLATNNQSYAVTRAVLLVFRSHLALRDVLAFAEILPPLLREPHNIAPDSAIDDVAGVLRAEVGEGTLRRILGHMSQDAQACWLTA